MSTFEPVTRSYWLHALTPLHIGAGQGAGFVDLPVVREAVTHWPYAPGSAVKGVVADRFGATKDQRSSDPKLRAAFGKEPDLAGISNAGSLGFTDARLICLPVRSFFGTFAWCTSPSAIERLRRDLTISGYSCPGSLTAQAGVLVVATNQAGGLGTDLVRTGQVQTQAEQVPAYLEDLDFHVSGSAVAAAWARYVAKRAFPEAEWQGIFIKRFAVVEDEVFDFFCQTALQVEARVRIDPDMKTVQRGALWYEESLPAESILSGLVWCGRVFGDSATAPTQSDLVTEYCTEDQVLQIGGKFSTGRGHVRLRFDATPNDVSSGEGA